MPAKYTTAFLALLGLAAVASASKFDNFEQYAVNSKNLPSRRQIKKGHFGATEIAEFPEEGPIKMAKEVYPPTKDFVRDYERQTRALQQAQVQDRVNRERMAANKIFSCDNRGNGTLDPDEAGYFIPVSVGALNSEQPEISYTAGTCFKNIKFSYAQTGFGEEVGDVTVTIDTEGAASLFCRDWFLFATAGMQHVETFYFSGLHTITFKNMTIDNMAEIADGGIRIYMFCDGYVDTFTSVYNTALCFVGGLGTDPNVPIWGSHVPDYME